MPGWFEFTPPVQNPAIVLTFQFILSILVVIIISCVIALIKNTTIAPVPPKGWASTDYEAIQNGRKSLQDYMSANNIDDKTPMNQFHVATAGFGGIFTEDIKLLNPWNGSASPDAARIQVEAGARAIVLDIWPDPANNKLPVVCCMTDATEWSAQNWWIGQGLDKGAGRYSNWRHITRNRMPAADIINTALHAAFDGPTSKQNADPFFLILKLHGAMTPDFLNTLGDTVKAAIGEHSMSPEWNRTLNQKQLCSAPVREFMSKCFVMVIPDIQPGYNSLPNINTYASFIQPFLATRLGEVTNALEQQPNTIFFEPGSLTTISTINQPNCTLGGPQLSLAQAGLTVIQPTTGGQSTDNATLYANTNLQQMVQSGAQFIAINYFSPNSGDGIISDYLNPANFGIYSFKKGV
jgi:hypothetical protein